MWSCRLFIQSICIIFLFDVAGAACEVRQDAKTQVVVLRYLHGLVHLNHDEMAACLADHYTWRFRGVATEFLRDDMRGVRQMEKTLHTKWRFRVLGVSGDKVDVEEVEDNEAYQLLGVGKRTQTVTYLVHDGKIHEVAMGEYRHEHGDWHEVNKRFSEWLAARPEGSDLNIVREGSVQYRASSASQLLKLLKEYSRTKSK